MREVSGEGCDIALVAENDRGEIVGEAYAAILSQCDAEAAFVVRDGDQRHGVGTALLAAMVTALRSRGVTTLHAETAATNVPMLALFHAGDRPVRTRRFEGTVRVTMEIGSDP